MSDGNDSVTHFLSYECPEGLKTVKASRKVHRNAVGSKKDVDKSFYSSLQCYVECFIFIIPCRKGSWDARYSWKGKKIIADDAEGIGHKTNLGSD